MRVDLPSGSHAEVALPSSPPSRGVVVIPDIHGLRPLFDALVARLADEQQWAVAAIEPFPGQHLETVDERFAAVPALDDSRLLGDAAAAADLLQQEAGVPRVGVIGFCMGGMYAYKAASTGRFDRAVSFYGMIRLPVAWRGPGQQEPLSLLESERSCPVLSIIGDQDPYTPPEDVAELLRFATLVQTVRFADAEHGFVHDPERPAHRPADAAEAWRQAVEFLR